MMPEIKKNIYIVEILHNLKNVNITHDKNQQQGAILSTSLLDDAESFFQIKAYILFEVRHLDSTSYHK